MNLTNPQNKRSIKEADYASLEKHLTETAKVIDGRATRLSEQLGKIYANDIGTKNTRVAMALGRGYTGVISNRISRIIPGSQITLPQDEYYPDPIEQYVLDLVNIDGIGDTDGKILTQILDDEYRQNGSPITRIHRVVLETALYGLHHSHFLYGNYIGGNVLKLATQDNQGDLISVEEINKIGANMIVDPKARIMRAKRICDQLENNNLIGLVIEEMTKGNVYQALNKVCKNFLKT